MTWASTHISDTTRFRARTIDAVSDGDGLASGIEANEFERQRNEIVEHSWAECKRRAR